MSDSITLLEFRCSVPLLAVFLSLYSFYLSVCVDFFFSVYLSLSLSPSSYVSFYLALSDLFYFSLSVSLSLVDLTPSLSIIYGVAVFFPPARKGIDPSTQSVVRLMACNGR